jgi:hypothetical protein
VPAKSVERPSADHVRRPREADEHDDADEDDGERHKHEERNADDRDHERKDRDHEHGDEQDLRQQPHQSRAHRFGTDAGSNLLHRPLPHRRHDQRKQNEHQHATMVVTNRWTRDASVPNRMFRMLMLYGGNRLTVGADTDLVDLAEHLRLRIALEWPADSRHLATNDSVRSERESAADAYDVARYFPVDGDGTSDRDDIALNALVLSHIDSAAADPHDIAFAFD